MSKLQEKFEQYHADNPHVYHLYLKFAKECVDAGMKKLSISLLTERIRWETRVVTKSNDGFKISNNHAALYARKLNEESMFKDMFPTKQLRSV